MCNDEENIFAKMRFFGELRVAFPNHGLHCGAEVICSFKIIVKVQNTPDHKVIFTLSAR
jgi:hypothetical protein